ncbi:hypothetical protein [Streptomyces fuscigenes]|uniref:hypothetical protein n=1 Tax=Streptomyces fuscigenes TaxID=1528880 RepID=UPI001F2C92E7|nr:hypothetical protein [Streptomyces fuscigenes]MCF3960331.1 hypothetical protein [Streptomyces fuscigenes]
MSVDVLLALVVTFPVWAPVCAVGAVVLLVLALGDTWGHGPEDTGDHASAGVLTVWEDVPAVEDTGDTSPGPPAVTCGDTVPQVSPDESTGGP